MKCLAATLLMLAAMAGSAQAQVPGAPAAPPGAAAPAAAPAQPATIWSKLGLSCEQIHQCKKRLCKTPLGQMINSMLAPVRLASGGLIEECCPTVPTAEDLANMKPGEVSPAEEAAAKIKAQEAGAKARRAAVRYLGTVDCHYYPEAELALIAALRADTNECVRTEAAIALGNGCCCTTKTIEALNIVVTGSDKDGNPVETSERVKMCALEALQKCLARGGELAAPEPPELPPLPKELPPGPRLEAPLQSIKVTSHTAPLPPGPEGRTVQSPLRTFAETASTRRPSQTLATGSRSVFEVVRFSTGQTTETAAVVSMPAAAAAPQAGLRPINLTPIGAIPP